MSLWSQLVLSLWVLASGHDDRKGSTGHLHGALHPEVPEVIMSLSAKGDIEEEARKRVMRRDFGSQSAVATDDATESSTEEPEDVDTDVNSDAASGVSTDAPTEQVATDDATGSSTEAPEASSDAASGVSTDAPTEQVDTEDETAESPSGTLDPAAETMGVEVKVPQDASGGTLSKDQKVASEEEEEAGDFMGLDGEQQDLPSPDACDSGGSSEPQRPLTFNVYAPAQAPFTLSFRTKWTGVDPPNMEPNPVCIFCWTINPDTAPSSNKAQFFRGVDGQPPRIALMRMGNVIAYEELSADGKDGLANSITSETKLNDGSEHEVVLVRGISRITLWIDGEPDCFISSDSSAGRRSEKSERRCG